MNYTADQITLAKHIQTINAETQAWVDEDPDNRWAGMLVDDPWHWAGYEIYTVAQFDHYMAACSNFEMYRSIHGYKPNWSSYASMTTEEIKADTDRMVLAETKEQEQEAAEAEKLAEKLGQDVETLKRWGVV